MRDLLDRYLGYLKAERNASAYTVRNYLNDLLGNYKRGPEKGFFQYLKLKKIESLAQVNRNILRGYIAWLVEKKVVRASITRKLSVLRSFFRYLVREGLLAEDPMKNISSPKLDKRLPSFLTIEETIRLLTAPDTTRPLGQRDRALLELLYASGLRVSELVSLDVGQIDLAANEIRVRGKGDKERLVLIGRPASLALQAYLNSGRRQLDRKKTHALFLGRYGGRLPARTIQKILKGYADSAKIKKWVHPHLLRHTFATHMLNGGADLRVVQELLGHAQLTSTQIYTHVSKTQARKVYLATHPMAGKKRHEREDTQTPAEVASEAR